MKLQCSEHISLLHISFVYRTSVHLTLTTLQAIVIRNHRMKMSKLIFFKFNETERVLLLRLLTGQTIVNWCFIGQKHSGVDNLKRFYLILSYNLCLNCGSLLGECYLMYESFLFFSNWHFISSWFKSEPLPLWFCLDVLSTSKLTTIL